MSNKQMVTLTNNGAFEILQASDNEKTIASGYVMYTAKVIGFRLRDTLALSVRRNRSNDGTWTATISVSTGGRDSTVRSDADAYLNYAKALEYLSKFGKSLEQSLEQAYQKAKSA